MTVALALSMILLLTAPLNAHLLGRLPGVRAGIDGFILLAVTGMVFLTLLPEAIAGAHVYGLVAAVLAFCLPWIAERLFHAKETETHRVLLLLASGSLVLHAAADGGILALSGGLEHGLWVESGILLHRFGLGMTIWWVLNTELPRTVAMAVLIAMAAATLAGYWLGPDASHFQTHGDDIGQGVFAIGIWQGVAGGSLLHVVMHPLTESTRDTAVQTRLAHRMGTAVGLGFLVTMILLHGTGHMATPHGAAAHHPESSQQDVEASVSNSLIGSVDSYGADHAGHGPNMLDLLLVVGERMGPILCLILVLAALLGYLRGGQSMLDAATKAAPFTLFLWLSVALGAGLVIDSPIALATDQHDHGVGFLQVDLFWSLWVMITCFLVIRSGARAFFSPVFKWLMAGHKHDHAH